MNTNLLINIATIVVWSAVVVVFVYFWLAARRSHERREKAQIQQSKVSSQ